MLARMLFAVAVLTVMAGCEDRGDAVEVEPTPDPVSYQEDILPIFVNSCALSSCHVQPAPTGNMILEAGRAYSQTVDVPASGTYPGWIRVQPGEPEASLVYRKLVTTGVEGIGDRMPAAGSITGDQIELIRRWIEEGAAY